MDIFLLKDVLESNAEGLPQELLNS